MYLRYHTACWRIPQLPLLPFLWHSGCTGLFVSLFRFSGRRGCTFAAPDTSLTPISFLSQLGFVPLSGQREAALDSCFSETGRVRYGEALALSLYES